MSALDLELNGRKMDIRSITGDGNYVWALLQKNKQAIKYNNAFNENADAVCLYFHDASKFSERKIRKAINAFRFSRYNKGALIEKVLKTVVCVVNGENSIREYDIK